MGKPQKLDDSRNPFDLSDLRTIDGLIAENPAILNERTIRFQLRHRSENGLDKYCVRLGKYVLISKTGYEKWLVERGPNLLARRQRTDADEQIRNSGYNIGRSIGDETDWDDACT